MLQIRINAPANATTDVLQVLNAQSTVSGITVLTGASVKPPGDVVVADMAREVVNDVVDRLCDIGVQRDGIIQIEPVSTWISRPGFAAEQVTPGGGADSVVWASVIQRSYDDSESNWTYLSFMTLATLLAGIAIILDSQVLLMGAMILGPDFGPVAALGVALVRGVGICCGSPWSRSCSGSSWPLRSPRSVRCWLGPSAGSVWRTLPDHGRAPRRSTRRTSGPSSSRSSQVRPVPCR